MPAVSKSQRSFFGMVVAAKRGKLKKVSPAIKRAMKSMTEKQAVDFASTKTKKLPEKSRNAVLNRMSTN